MGVQVWKSHRYELCLLCGVACLGPLARALLLQEDCSKEVNPGLFQCLINCPNDWCNLPGELPAPRAACSQSPACGTCRDVPESLGLVTWGCCVHPDHGISTRIIKS